MLQLGCLGSSSLLMLNLVHVFFGVIIFSTLNDSENVYATKGVDY